MAPYYAECLGVGLDFVSEMGLGSGRLQGWVGVG